VTDSCHCAACTMWVLLCQVIVTNPLRLERPAPRSVQRKPLVLTPSASHENAPVRWMYEFLLSKISRHPAAAAGSTMIAIVALLVLVRFALKKSRPLPQFGRETPRA
jgi:hypothetical protein